MPQTFPHPDVLQIQECERVLARGKSNPVWELLRQSPPFVQWTHYPQGDVHDLDSHSQYFYHAHPPSSSHPNPTPRDENGHFHLFIRQPHLMLSEDAPLPFHPGEDLTHLIALSMDALGRPLAFFTTNAWVTGETFYSAKALTHLIDYFNIDHSHPSWPLNLWLSSMIRIYREEIIDLIHKRDECIQAWQAQYPEANVYEDRRLEVLSSLPLPPSILQNC